MFISKDYIYFLYYLLRFVCAFSFGLSIWRILRELLYSLSITSNGRFRLLFAIAFKSSYCSCWIFVCATLGPNGLHDDCIEGMNGFDDCTDGRSSFSWEPFIPFMWLPSVNIVGLAYSYYIFSSSPSSSTIFSMRRPILSGSVSSLSSGGLLPSKNGKDGLN